MRFVPEREQETCGDTFARFVEHLRIKGLFPHVHTDTAALAGQSPFVIEAQFNCKKEYHDTKNILLTIVDGATLFLAAFLPLHDFDARVDAQAKIMRGPQLIKQYALESRYDVDASYFAAIRSKFDMDALLKQAGDDVIEELTRKIAADLILE